MDAPDAYTTSRHEAERLLAVLAALQGARIELRSAGLCRGVPSDNKIAFQFSYWP